MARNARSTDRGLSRSFVSSRKRKPQDGRARSRHTRLAIDQFEPRLALAVPGVLAIGGQTSAQFVDAGVGVSPGDLISISIAGTAGSVVFNGGNGVADGGTIDSIAITGASPNFQLTFNGAAQVGTGGAASDGLVQIGAITADSVFRGINTVKGPAVVGGPAEIDFVLTSFRGVNFSKGGGLFVDIVEGDAGNVGVVLTTGLIPQATIGIRQKLDASMTLGTTGRARVDGRLLIETATSDSTISVARFSDTQPVNSRFQLLGGQGQFAADVSFAGPFYGTVNLAGAATGVWTFSNGVTANGVLNASSWGGAPVVFGSSVVGAMNGFGSVNVVGNFSGQITATGNNPGLFNAIARFGEVRLNVTGSVTSGARINAADSLLLTVGRDFGGAARVGGSPVLGTGSVSSLMIIPFSFGSVSIGRAMLNTGSIQSGGILDFMAGGNYAGRVEADTLRFNVGGSVAPAGRIVAQTVTDYTGFGGQSFRVGKTFEGVLNAATFDGVGGSESAELIGGGTTKHARFNVGQFIDENSTRDTYSFGGPFLGNIRVLQDLAANLSFSGDVNMIKVGGLVTSDIVVGGKLRYLNSNSYFVATSNTGGTFSDGFGNVGSLSTGRGYVTVVPQLPSFPLAVPFMPQNLTGSWSVGDNAIKVTFSAPLSDGGSPVTKYQYSTNAGTPGEVWRDFDAPATPGVEQTLTVDSAGGAWIPGNTYTVSVRAVNVIGNGAACLPPLSITLPVPP